MQIALPFGGVLKEGSESEKRRKSEVSTIHAQMSFVKDAKPTIGGSLVGYTFMPGSRTAPVLVAHSSDSGTRCRGAVTPTVLNKSSGGPILRSGTVKGP
jgi:hypothetical protein